MGPVPCAKGTAPYSTKANGRAISPMGMGRSTSQGRTTATKEVMRVASGTVWEYICGPTGTSTPATGTLVSRHCLLLSIYYTTKDNIFCSFCDSPGLMHGRGRFEWAASGEVYNGHWVRGKMTGEGIKVQSDGCRLQGSFLGGELNGWGEKVSSLTYF